MKYEILPVINARDLADALNIQYGWNEDSCDLCSFLFYDDYNNDSCKRYSFDQMEVYEGKSWQDEDSISKENAIKAFLQDIFPGYSQVLIDVSW